MDFELSPEQQAAKDRASAFVEEVCRPLEKDWAADDYDVPVDTLMHVARKFREYGLRGLSVPTEVGGLGLGTLAKSLVYEEIVKSHVTHGALTTWSGLMEPNAALYSAPEWQKEKYLYPLLNDERFHHIHISEPDTGSDAANLSTTAVRKGDTYIINGVKRWAPPPTHPMVKPDYLLCFAVTTPGAGYEGISAFLVDYPNPGVSIGEEYRTLASGFLSRSCDYHYENVVVPAENILGAEGMGFRYMMDQLNRNRVAIGARLLGVAQWAQDRAIARVKQRMTFGKPLADRQAIQWMLADSEMDIEQLRGLIYRTAWMLDNKIDARKQVAMVKCAAPLVSARVIDRSIQVHGGMGLVDQTGLTQLAGEARVSQIAEGTTEVMRMTIARAVLREA